MAAEREIEVRFLIRLIDPRPDESRESVEQMLDAIAYGIDLDFRNEKSPEYGDGLRWAQPTEIMSWKERDHFTEPGQEARMDEIRNKIREIKEALDAKAAEQAYPDVPAYEEPRNRYVNAYSVSRNYGGPEEGGWWYDSYDPLASVPVRLDREEEEVKALLTRIVGWEPDPRNRIGRYSVNGGSDFVIRVEDHMAEPYPTERPHYE